MELVQIVELLDMVTVELVNIVQLLDMVMHGGVSRDC